MTSYISEMLYLKAMWIKRSLLVAGFMLLLVSQGYSQTWNPSFAPYGRNINDAEILPDGRMVLVGGNQSNDAIWSIFTSSSTGLSWNIDLDLIQPWSTACSFYNGQKGVAVGEAGSMKRTTNGGHNWTDLSSLTVQTLNDVFFVDSAHGFAVGGLYTSEDTFQVVLKSVNGGLAWSVLIDQAGRPLRSVYFTDANKGVAVGDNGMILKTLNGGQNWSTITPPIHREFNTVEFINSSTGFIVGGRLTNDSIRTLLKTVNGGDSWSVLMDEPGGWLRDINFIDQNVGYAVGDVATVLKTTDGGTIWNPETLPALTGYERFNTVDFLSADLGLVAGDFGSIYIWHNIPAPEVETLPAMVQQSETEILFQGTVNTFGNAGQYSFLFSEDPNAGFSEYMPVDITSSQPQLVGFLGTFFTPATTYYYCAKAATIGGVAYGDTLSITTTIPFNALSMDSVRNQETGMPSFHGTVSGLSESAELFFEYGTSLVGGTEVAATPAMVSDGSTYVPTYTAPQMLADGFYFVRLKAVSSNGTYYSNALQFLIGQPFGQLTMVSATYDLISEEVLLEGFVDGATASGNFTFSYSEAGTFGPMTDEPAVPNVLNDQLPHTLTATISGLEPNIEYRVQLSMSTAYGFYFSAPITFYTSVSPANFATRTATQITPTTAILNGLFNQLNYDVDLFFEFGQTTQFGQTIAASPDHVSGNSTYDIAAQLQGLAPNTLYYYRLKAETPDGAFYAQTRQFFTGPPEIPNWDFQNWEARIIEVPIGWNLPGVDLERVDLGGGNSALKLFGVNGAIMGYLLLGTEEQDGFPSLISTTPFSYRPDSVYFNMDYAIAPGDTAVILLKLDSADVNLAMDMYFVSGSSGGEFTELSYEINYSQTGTPDQVLFLLLSVIPGSEYTPSATGHVTFDRIHFGPDVPPIDKAEFNDWNSFSYMDIDGWSYFRFLGGASGDLNDPPSATPVLYALPNDTAVHIKNKIYGNTVIVNYLQVGSNPFDESQFAIDRKHEVLTGYVQFDRQGTDTLQIELRLLQDSLDVGYATLNLTESTLGMVPFEIPIWYHNYFGQEIAPDSATLEISIINTDNVSLSEALIDKLCFDGFYVGHIDSIPDGIIETGTSSDLVIYPNPTTGLVTIKGINPGADLSIVDLKGTVLLRRTANTTAMQWDLSALASGIYVLHVNMADSTVSKRLLILPPNNGVR